jgi:hypothetical protein
VAAPPTPVTPPVAGGFVARPRLAGITIDATVLLLTVQADQLSEHSRGLALGHLKQTARVAQARTVTPVVRRPAPEARAHPHRHHLKSADGHARRWHTDRGHGHRGHVHRH